MDNNIKDDQIEALETLADYIPKLIGGIDTVKAELRGERKPDTDEYLKMIIDGINWVLGIVNGCMRLFEEYNIAFDKEKANDYSVAFSNAYGTGNDTAIADSMDADVIPMIRLIQKTADEALDASR